MKNYNPDVLTCLANLSNDEVVREVDTAIVDLSHSHSSREFIRDYDASPDAKATV